MTQEDFKKIFPKANPNDYGYLVKYMEEYHIERDEVLNFLATLSHESSGLTKWEENLNYSAGRLKEIFPKYFFPSTTQKAEDYSNKPEKIANWVYSDSNRSKTSKLGNTSIGDGWKYRGSGPIGITGKSNFDQTGKRIGYDLINNPDLLRTNHAVGIKAACEWYSRVVLGK